MLWVPIGLLAAMTAGYLGRLSMRNYWRLDLPYKDRPTLALRGLGCGGWNVPRIPNRGWL